MSNSEKKGLGTKISTYFREMRSELKKVVWPNRKQLINNTAIVLVALVVFGALVAGLDFVFRYVVDKIILSF